MFWFSTNVEIDDGDIGIGIAHSEQPEEYRKVWYSRVEVEIGAMGIKDVMGLKEIGTGGEGVHEEHGFVVIEVLVEWESLKGNWFSTKKHIWQETYIS